MGLLEAMFLGETTSTKCGVDWCRKQQFGFSFQDMADHRLGHGFEPIDWPTIIVNQFRAIALTRPLNIWEQCMYDGAIQKVKDTKKA